MDDTRTEMDTVESAILAHALRTPLDEVRSWLGTFVRATPTQLDAVALWIAHTHVMDACVTTPRMLITSDTPGAGKTLLLNIIRDLSHLGFDGNGTSYAFRSALAEARGHLTISYDEVSDVFGRSGMNQSNSLLAQVLRRGYKKGATEAWSVGRVSEPIDIFVPVAMTGLRTAVPHDIYTRCVEIELKPGEPEAYYDIREAEHISEVYRDSLRAWLRARRDEISRFRAAGLHDKLTGRLLEIWEPLLAVASAADVSGSWLERGLEAFATIALDDSQRVILTPDQTIVRDMARAAGELDKILVFGSELRALMRTYEQPMYETMSDRSLSMAMARVMPVPARVITRGSSQGRGWEADTIMRVWAAVRPRVTVPTAEEMEEDDPFTITNTHKR